MEEPANTSVKVKRTRNQINPNMPHPEINSRFRLNDKVFGYDVKQCAWFEGRIMALIGDPYAFEREANDIIYYGVEFMCGHGHAELYHKDIRYRAKRCGVWELLIGEKVMVNYNVKNPTNPADLWYEFTVCTVDLAEKFVTGTLHLKRNGVQKVENVRINEDDGITRIFVRNNSIDLPIIPMDGHGIVSTERSREICDICQNRENYNCVYCCCRICSRRVAKHCKIPCKECHKIYHSWCVGSPYVQQEFWRCSECKKHRFSSTNGMKENDGHKMDADDSGYENDDHHRKRSFDDISSDTTENSPIKRPSSKSLKDVYNKVDLNHFGPVPGVLVGTCWKYRLLVNLKQKVFDDERFQSLYKIRGIFITRWASLITKPQKYRIDLAAKKLRTAVAESGIHRPLVAGIHGRENEGAYSIVLSGCYDDMDEGDEFIYSGCGGKSQKNAKSKKTKVKEQNCDQELLRQNKALAVSCKAPFNDEVGAESQNWRLGKPVRVIRNYKLRKYSKFAPKEGNRYDGIYKVVKYYPEMGPHGYKIWRFLLRRDDPEPAPWTEEGKRMIREAGLKIIYPKENESMYAAKEREVEYLGSIPYVEEDEKRVEKYHCIVPIRVVKDALFDDMTEGLKMKEEVWEMTTADAVNKSLWDFCLSYLNCGRTKFLATVTEMFKCADCRELVNCPVTTPCHHNICFGCVRSRFLKKYFTCPHCQFNLNNYKPVLNVNLNTLLSSFFPGYNMK